MSKLPKVNKTPIIIALIPLIIALLLVMFPLLPKIKFPAKIDSRVKSQLDAYIASIVGEKEFRNNYEINLMDSQSCNLNSSFCYIDYEFLPGKVYEKNPTYLFYYSNDGNQSKVSLANNHVPLALPSCELDKYHCKWTISKKELSEIAKRENLGSGLTLVMYQGAIVAQLSYCNMETMQNRRKIYVDLQTGKTVWDGPNSECQGIY